MKTKHLFLCLLALVACACSSSDETDQDSGKGGGYSWASVDTIPQWQMDWSYNQERPNWQEPNTSNYENWTVMLVQIEEELQPYVTPDDLMALFVGTELRGLASPAFDVSEGDTQSTFFLLKTYGNEADNEWMDVTLMYYNSRLNHIFARMASARFAKEQVFGIDEDFIPDFTYGSTKYPVVMSLALDATAIADANIVPTAGDKVAAFVGDECRGAASSSGRITIYGRQEGETVTLKYYEATKHRVLTIDNATKTQQQQITSIIIQ